MPLRAARQQRACWFRLGRTLGDLLIHVHWVIVVLASRLAGGLFLGIAFALDRLRATVKVPFRVIRRRERLVRLGPVVYWTELRTLLPGSAWRAATVAASLRSGDPCGYGSAAFLPDGFSLRVAVEQLLGDGSLRCEPRPSRQYPTSFLGPLLRTELALGFVLLHFHRSLVLPFLLLVGDFPWFASHLLTRLQALRRLRCGTQSALSCESWPLCAHLRDSCLDCCYSPSVRPCWGYALAVMTGRRGYVRDL